MKFQTLNTVRRYRLQFGEAWRKIRREGPSDRVKKAFDSYMRAQYLERRVLKNYFMPDLSALLDEEISGYQRITPTLMFPVRLETRFRHDEKELWVRVFPDTCSIDTFDPVLTEEEITAGRLFWSRYLAARIKVGKRAPDKEEKAEIDPAVETRQRTAWKDLAGFYGSGRAHWIVQQVLPLKAVIPAPAASEDVCLMITTTGLPAPDDQEALETYWKAYYEAVDKTGQEEAWNVLTGEVGKEAAQNLVDAHRLLYFPQPPENWAGGIAVKWLRFAPTPEQSKGRRRKAEAWARLLPDFFVLVAERGKEGEEDFVQKIVISNPVLSPLPVSPSFAGSNELGPEPTEEVKWMMDFEDAVAKGMGFKVALENADLDYEGGGFDRIFVFGMRHGQAPEDGSEAVEQLLARHYGARAGFEFLPQGTPTNNTDETAAGYSRRDDPEASFQRLAPWFEAIVNDGEGDAILLKGVDGQYLERALGLPLNSLLRWAAHYDGRDQNEAIAMNTLLYPATLGYFLIDPELMGGIFTDTTRFDILNFFLTYVRGRGLLPAVRIGRQPYGILPTAAFSKLDWNIELGLTSHPLGKARDLWNFVKNVYEKAGTTTDEGPLRSWIDLQKETDYVGRILDEESAHQVILNILGLHSGSVAYGTRRAVLPDSPTDFDENSRHLLNQLADNIIESTTLLFPNILHKSFDNYDTLLTGPVIDDHPLSEVNEVDADFLPSGEEITRNYLQWWTEQFDKENYNAVNEIIRFGTLEKRKPDPLLYLLARRGLKAGLVNVVQRTALKTIARIPTARLERLLAEHLDVLSYRLDAWRSGLIGWRMDLMRQQNPSGIYIGAYGWLEEVRPKSPPEVFDTSKYFDKLMHFGKTAKEETRQEMGLGEGTVLSDSTNAGYIHAPSLNQAVTAALLRSGEIAHANGDAADASGPYSVNLSSERVRWALTIVEGIRQGQDPGALLGYQFERFLHDVSENTPGVELDQYIYPLREAFPIAPTEEELDTEEAVETLTANNVVNGLDLIREVQDSEATGVLSAAKDVLTTHIEGLTEEDKTRLAKQVERLVDLFDGLADLALAESVHHATQGNYERAAAHLDAFSRGTYPPEYDLIRTQRNVSFRSQSDNGQKEDLGRRKEDLLRTGATLTHRVALHMGPTDAGADTTPRAMVNPALNGWLREVLPALENIYYEVEEEDGAVPVRLSDIGIAPIDLLYLQPFQVEERAVHYAASNGESAASLETTYAYSDIAPLLRNLKALALTSRPLQPQDLVRASGAETEAPGLIGAPVASLVDSWNNLAGMLEQLIVLLDHYASSKPPVPKPVDANEDETDPKLTEKWNIFREKFEEYSGELEALVDRLRERFKPDATHLAEKYLLIPKTPPDSLPILEDLLLQLNLHGFPETEISSFREETNERTKTLKIMARLLTLIEAVAVRLGESEKILHDLGIQFDDGAPTATFSPEKFEVLQQVARLLLGEDFMLLPTFTPGESWRSAHSKDNKVVFCDPGNEEPVPEQKETLFVEDWLHGVARVREKMRCWEQLTFLTEAFGTKVLEMKPVQLSPETYGADGKYWLAVQYPDHHRVQGDHLLYTAWYPEDLPEYAAEGKEVCGLLLDEWTEIVPGDNEVTGLAFHFDRPNAEAPQAILLAVPHKFQGDWTWRELLDILRETLEMAKDRAVEPDQLLATPFAQLLPATVFKVGDLNLSANNV